MAQEDIRRGITPDLRGITVPRGAGVLPAPPDYKPPYQPLMTDLPTPTIGPVEPYASPPPEMPPEKMRRLLDLAFEAAQRILEMSFDANDPDFLKKAALQQQVLSTVISTQARVDEGKLRGKADDKFGELLERLKVSREA